MFYCCVPTYFKKHPVPHTAIVHPPAGACFIDSKALYVRSYHVTVNALLQPIVTRRIVWILLGTEAARTALNWLKFDDYSLLKHDAM